ncbi:hypothetical protein L8U00_05870, partial [Campylobacter sp. IFREMER_LSEM_CL2256]|uniref:hypothetical protein n=1 Tax=Campylobacter sp. IFREMER_LSEM_CL2256 TaxID=2911622 RepID=UPI0021E8B67A
MEIKSNATNVTINNAGTIKGNGGGRHGIEIWGSSTVDKITNTGTIDSGSGSGLSVTNNSTLKNLENSGIIKGNDKGIKVDNGATIEKIINNGLIFGNTAGIYLSGENKINTISNSGTILSNNGNVNWGAGGIVIQGKDDKTNIENLINDGAIINKTGAFNSGGIALFSGNIKTFINNGDIISNSEGIFISVHTPVNKPSKIEFINNKKNIIATNNGIWIEKSGGNIGSVETINNEGVILGKKNSGILIDPDQHIKDYIKLDGSDALIAGGTIGIYNKGTIGVNNNNGSLVNNGTGNVIDLQNGATIAALTFSEDGSTYTYNQEGTAILNEGNIQGNINLDGGSKIIGLL